MGTLWLSVLTDRFPDTTPVRLLAATDTPGFDQS